MDRSTGEGESPGISPTVTGIPPATVESPDTLVFMAVVTGKAPAVLLVADEVIVAATLPFLVLPLVDVLLNAGVFVNDTVPPLVPIPLSLTIPADFGPA